MELIISLLGGALGGNLAGSLMKNYSLGTLWNSVVGILGGGLGAQLLGMLGVMGTQGGSMDIAGILSNVVSSGVGGGVLLLIVGVIRGLLGK